MKHRPESVTVFPVSSHVCLSPSASFVADPILRDTVGADNDGGPKALGADDKGEGLEDDDNGAVALDAVDADENLLSLSAKLLDSDGALLFDPDVFLASCSSSAAIDDFTPVEMPGEMFLATIDPRCCGAISSPFTESYMPCLSVGMSVTVSFDQVLM